MDTCPVCGSQRIFRSRTRTRLERLRRDLTSKRPYRCHACNWRGWAPEGLLVTADGDVADATPTPPDLRAIDSALSKAPNEPQDELQPVRLPGAGSVKREATRRKRASG